MMKKACRICCWALCAMVSLFCSSSPADVFDVDPLIVKSYQAADYALTAKTLEEKIHSLKGNLSTENMATQETARHDLYASYLFLAYLYAWRLDKRDLALSKYAELRAVKRSYATRETMLTMEYLFEGEIYEKSANPAKAAELYRTALNETVAWRMKETDTVMGMMYDDMISLIKYQIHGVAAKMSASGKQGPLLKRMRCRTGTSPLAVTVAMSFSPTALYELAVLGNIEVVDHINRSTKDLGSMMIDYALAVNAADLHGDKSWEEIMQSYVAKYPEAYYSLSARCRLYEQYERSGRMKDAQRIKKELERIGTKRGIEILVGPDRRFSSPLRTWETYRKALREGDMELAWECYAPGQRPERETLARFSQERVWEWGGTKASVLNVVASNDMEATYTVAVERDGKEALITIIFNNIDGEWKMNEL